MACAVMVLLIFGSYTRRTTVDGIVVPDAGLLKVYAKHSGIVISKTVTEGRHVARGEVLYTISTDVQSSTDRQVVAALLERAKQRRRLLVDEQDKVRRIHSEDLQAIETKTSHLVSDLVDLDRQIKIQIERVSIAREGVSRLQTLRAKDVMSPEQLQERKVGLLDQQSKLLSMQRERTQTEQAKQEATHSISSLRLRQLNQVSEIERSILEIDQSLIENEVKRETVVVAPQDGVATAAFPQVGQTIDTNVPVVAIVPDGMKWQLDLFVTSAAAGFINEGDAVQVRFQAFPYQKFGQYPARVTSITRSTTPINEASNNSRQATVDSQNGVYRVVAALEKQTVHAYGKPQSLQAGMTVQADIMRERRRLYEWVLEPLYSLSGKL